MLLTLGIILFSGTLANSLEKKQYKLDKGHYTLIGFTVFKDTPDDVMRELGKTVPPEREDRKHDPYVYCYTSRDHSDIFLQFHAGWASGFKELTGYVMEQENSFPSGTCVPSDRIDKNLKTGGGLYLGMSKDEVISLIPGEPEKDGDTYKFVLEHSETLSEQSEFRKTKGLKKLWETEFVYVTFKNDKLTRLMLSVFKEYE